MNNEGGQPFDQYSWRSSSHANGGNLRESKENDADYDDMSIWRDSVTDNQRYSRRGRRSRSRSRSDSPEISSYQRILERSRRRSHSRERERRRERRIQESRHQQLPQYTDEERRQRGQTCKIPNNTIVVRALPKSCDENTLWLRLTSLGVVPLDIQLARDPDTNESKGYAYVEFETIDKAVQWMNNCNGEFDIDGHQPYPWLEYDEGDNPLQPMPQQHVRIPTDWTCPKCGVHNYSRRERCFKCRIDRPLNASLHIDSGDHDVGVLPCDTLLFRDLPPGTLESDIRQALSRTSMLEPTKIQISDSSRFAYVQMASIFDAQRLHTTLNSITQLKIGGIKITVSFSTMPLSTMTSIGGNNASDNSNAAAAYAANAMARATNSRMQRREDIREKERDRRDYGDGRDRDDLKFMQPHPAALQAASMQQQYDGNPGPTVTTSSMDQLYQHQKNQILSQAAQAASAQLKNLLQGNTTGGDAPLGTVKTEHGILPVYPPPDTSTYQYEPTSGYYFDPSTGLYYDGATRLFFNADLNKWLYWCGELRTYLPCAERQTPVAEVDRKKAVEIAKQMEDWAKKSNKDKEKKKDKEEDKEKKNIKVSMSFKKAVAATPALLSAKPSTSADETNTNLDNLIADKNSNSDSEPENGIRFDDPSTHIDADALTCKLCQRQLNSLETLNKHVAKSTLHKENLEKLKVEEEQKMKVDDIVNQANKYRDRAKERREKFGTDEATRRVEPPCVGKLMKPSPWVNTVQFTATQQFSQSIPEPPTEYNITQLGLPTTNVGSQLLSKMGWQAGTGLGRMNQGIVNPIEAEQRVKGAGLGAPGAKINTNQPANFENLPAEVKYRMQGKAQIWERYQRAGQQ